MKSWLTGLRRRYSLAIGCGVMSSAAALGCGLDWQIPQLHFDSVNEQGYVCYFEKVAELDLGDDLKLPLIINFKSNRDIDSPYLGRGWMLLLLESQMVQTGESRFTMIQPDGWNNFFVRRKPADSVLEGSMGWKAEIKGPSLISAWAPCGWRIDFVNGRISAITTPKNRKLEFVYNGSTAVAIREKGVPILQVELDKDGKSARALTFNGKRMEIERGGKPRVQVIAGQRVVGAMDQSLHLLSGSEGETKQIDFAIDAKMRPNMKLVSSDESDRLITWDPQSRRVVSDGDWTYDIKPGEDPIANAAIGRMNAQKRKEFWHYEGDQGREVIGGINGLEKVTTWFTTGKLRGQIRSIEESVDKIHTASYQASYNEFGRLSRAVWRTKGASLTETTQYDSDGNSLAAYRDGRRLWTHRWEAGKLVQKTFADGSGYRIRYEADGTTHKAKIAESKNRTRIYSGNYQ